ncbi:MAG: hypothetical protein ACRD8U_20165 [Pyrinomonadaceae bacterium]
MRSFKRLISLAGQPLAALCMLLVLVATTSAYSIVMRGGKLVEIPAQFSVTGTTLTYEAAPGFLVTLQMAAIDIPATELANNESPGSLMRRAVEKIQTGLEPNVSQVPKAARSITNRDHESFQRVRLDSEQAYEQRLKDQGLPPLAVIRAEAAANAERSWQEMARKRVEAEAKEKALELQAQISSLASQLGVLQARGSEVSTESPSPFNTFDNGYPVFDSYGQYSPYGQYGPYDQYGSYGPFGPYGPRGFYGPFGRSRVNPSLFRVPPGVPIGGAFGTSHVPSWSLGAPFGSSNFRGLRPRMFGARGTQVHRRGGLRGRSHGRRWR